MSSNSNSTVYIGNLDERVSERVLYDILIQAGRVVDLYIPRDKDSDKPKGYAFAEYQTPQIASYAVSLFSGLCTLHNRTLKFAISGQDKAVSLSHNSASKGRSHPHPHPHPQSHPINLTPISFRLSSNSNSNYNQNQNQNQVHTKPRRFDSSDCLPYP